MMQSRRDIYNAEQVERGRDLRLLVVRLRKDGKSYSEIGVELGFTRARAHRLYQRARELGEVS